MKRFTATAIAALITAGTVAAQSTTSDDSTAMTTGDRSMDSAQLIRTRDITGGAVYTTNEAGGVWGEGQTYDSISADWAEVGEIEDIVLDQSGKVIGMVVEVGGFLDIGDKHVMIELADSNFVAVDDQSYAIVTRLSEEQLEQMEGVNEGFWD